MNNHEIDKQIFISNYEIADIEAFSKIYVLEELMIYLPSSPTKSEKEIFQSLLGTLGLTYGYMDWVQSNNTFELIMQWREQTGNL